MNRERMRHNQTVQEAASQRAREANKRQSKRSCAEFGRRRIQRNVLKSFRGMVSSREKRVRGSTKGRPFFATGRALIDVEARELTRRVHNEQVIFNVFKAMRYPQEKDAENCMRVDVIDSIVQEVFEGEISSNNEAYTLLEELEEDAKKEEEVAEKFLPSKPEKVEEEK
ncbi:hypothetical protein PIB30_082566 [Stylosanthes scabra]|uniref:Uncharacterized protein n=1 Tax=Stylosanthes scabra TaxID=79078 RepID=A0ABU6SSI8_9FABA|nr:hypothetical protein [Stylosanthes scabra]